ncbi:type II toxin-antitoxin system RelE/ParE family toxin [Clostridium perfringens]|uniref:type II toxin-antitoxin system RelE/ParE family toxin n=1 Tax=Clostridium perfringens TaxID=1502 RepID=UPI002AF6C0E7|nr:type II toxin-antitoxin system RelE/ParE family toxin [Clostridium perfringens]
MILLNIFRYETCGGKDLILNYVDNLPARERAMYYWIQEKLQVDGVKAFEVLNTRQLKKKIWEIKFSKNRLMYVLEDSNNMYILHACKKQKGKAEKFELEKAIERAKELGEELDKNFV